MTAGEKRKQYGFVIRQLTAREMKRKYARSALGIFWSILNPLLSMMVLSLIFSRMFQKSIANFPVYYLTGYLLWQTFTGSTSASLTALTDNRLLLLRVKFPMEIFVTARVYTAIVNFFCSLAAYVVMLIVFQIKIRLPALMAPVILLPLFLFSLGMSWILSVGYVFFGDLKHLYTVALTLWMYCSGIFYPAEELGGLIRQVVFHNPMYLYIDGMRQVILYGQIPAAGQFAQMFLWGIGLFAAGWVVFEKKRDRIMVRL